jgi:uncharacterized protein (TIGR03067 family)
MRRSGWLAVAVVALLGADGPGKDKVAAELKAFEGTWRFSSVEVEGKTLPIEAFKETTLVLKGDRFDHTEGGQTTHGSFKVDPTVTPKTIDITFSDGPEAGKSVLGIYELEGDTYKVCIGMDGKSRPTEFASKAGSGVALEVLKRDPPKVK